MSHTSGPWFADHEGVIKRQRFDHDGNPAGYELLEGQYPREWAAASTLLSALKAVIEEAEVTPSAVLQRLAEQARAAVAKAEGRP